MVRARAVVGLARPAALRAEDLQGAAGARRPGRLEAYPVGTAVNSVRNNGAELLEPLPAEAGRVSRVRAGADAARRRPAGRDRSRHPVATLLLGHGAGGGIDAPDLAALAAALPRNGISVVRVEQPWRVAGRKVAPRPEVLDECFVAAADRLRVRTPLVVGGRSAGARSAARTARQLGASGVPGAGVPAAPARAARSPRGSTELEAVRVPTLVVQGERDPFGRPEEFPADRELTVVPGADHSSRCPSGGRSPPRRRWPSSWRRSWSSWCATWSVPPRAEPGNRTGRRRVPDLMGERRQVKERA